MLSKWPPVLWPDVNGKSKLMGQRVHLKFAVICCIAVLLFLGFQWRACDIMTNVPPPYAPGETKGLYPSVQGDPQQQPVVYTTPGTAAVTYYPSGPVQQQPQQLVIQQAPVVVAAQQPTQSFVCHILFSCCVTWCCFWPCGLLAFILASKTIFT